LEPPYANLALFEAVGKDREIEVDMGGRFKISIELTE
jgi:hypothetical protein